MVDIQERIREYFDNPSLNQSKVKAILKGLGTYLKNEPSEFSEDPQHFIYGGAVDMLLLTPQMFDYYYYVSELEDKPSDTIIEIIREVYSLKPKIILSLCEDEILQIVNEKNYQPNWKPETKVKKVQDLGKAYWEQLNTANGRTILSVAEKEKIDLMVETLKTHIHTAKYFEETNGWIIIPQMIIYFMYEGVQCKAMLDMVRVNQELKLIEPIDIKTIGSSTKSFPSNVKRFRYDIQAAWYTTAISELEALEVNSLYTIEIDEKWKVLPFKFIVESTSSPGICPLVYTMTEQDLVIAEYGTERTIGNCSIWGGLSKQIKGFREGVELYKWHEENDQWEIDKEIYELHGELPLEIWK